MSKVLRGSRKARLLRKERELTLKDVAQAVGLKEPTLGNFETGKTLLSPEALKRLADYFKVSPAELLEEVGSTPIMKEESGPPYVAKIDPETIRWLVRKDDDGGVIEKVASALRDEEMAWPNRLATARALLNVLEARHSGA